MRSSSSSPTLTTASTRRLVSRKYGARSSRGRPSGRPGRAGVPSASAAYAASSAATSSARIVRSSFDWRFRLLEPLLDGLEVGEGQLELDDAQVLERIGRARARRRPRTPAARTRWRRPRGCWPGTCCPAPRPCSPLRPGRRCRPPGPRRAPRSSTWTSRPAGRGARRAPWPPRCWGPWWRTRTARRARRRR